MPIDLVVTALEVKAGGVVLWSEAGDVCRG
jgi:hypothetical protein